MNSTTPHSISHKQFINILTIAASDPGVKSDVLDNYWENKWWPLTVDDWRLRILFAGLSTRVSYRGIKTYQNVRDVLTNMGFHKLSQLNQNEYSMLVKPLGLTKTRWEYWKSVKEFVGKFPDAITEPEDLRILSNDDLIKLIKSKIHGAGYKVAQCCVLYIRGYHCGIIPIDSGLKDMLGPCLGFKTNKSAMGNEIMRNHVEQLSKELDFQTLWEDTGYPQIGKSWISINPNTWWVHLALIYFKRRYCNLKDSTKCPLHKNTDLKSTMLCSCVN